MSRQLSRKEFLRLAGLSAGGMAMASCAPQVVEKVVTVKETVEVEKVVTVQETVEVPAAAPSGEKPLLRFAMYNFDPWLAALPKMFNDFEQEVGTAQVKLETAPWEQFCARFESQAAAGIAPDLQIGDPHL
jgi:ABC-type glycerol-3-phosphate transport system substrate-binding protein